MKTATLAQLALVLGGSPALSVLAKATLVFAAALAAVRLAGRRQAAVRHLVISAALVMLIVLPPAALMGPPIRLPVAVPVTPAGPVALGSPSGVAGRTAASAGATLAATGSRAVSLSAVLIALWAVGASLCILPLATGLIQLRNIRRAGAPWPRGQALFARLAGEARVRRRVDVLVHDDVSGPMTCGVLRPAIVFPPIAQSWSTADCHRAIVHELEHIRRADCFTDACARMVCAGYRMHPLVWIAWRRMRVEAERACDDAVLRSAEPTAYARQLVTLAERLAGKPRWFPAMANRGDLPVRVAAMLDDTQRRGRAGIAWIAGVALSAGLVAVVVSPLQAVQAPRDAAVVSPPRLAFELATVKENTSGDPSGGGDRTNTSLFPGGRFTATNVTLRQLILLAYRDEITRSQLDDGPDWIDSKRFDVVARAAEDVIAPGEIDRPRAQLLDRMLQRLLADRFRLQLRRETKPGQQYVLTATPKGPKMRPASDADCSRALKSDDRKAATARLCHSFSLIGRRGMVGPRVDTADIAQGLQLVLAKPVIDRVRLPGVFDVEVYWRVDEMGGRPLPPGEPQAGDGLPDMFTALREQLGLQLGVERAPVLTLIIDRAEPPAPE